MTKRKEKASWFYVEPFVHISLKKKRLLLYNTLNGKAIEWEASSPENSVIFSIVKRLLSNKNLRVVRLTEKEIRENPLLAKFVNKTINYHMGDLLDVPLSTGKPIQMAPMLSIQRGVERLRKEPDRSVGEYVLGYLDEISFYINENCELDSPLFYNGWKQFLCCRESRGRETELTLGKIKILLDDASGSPLSRINILGGNIFNHSRFPALLGLLGSQKAVKTFHLHYTQLENREKELQNMAALDEVKLRILADFPVQKKLLGGILQSVAKSGLDAVFEFIVASEADFREAQGLITALHIENYSFQPFYNDRNLGFFKKFVFLKKKAVLASKPTMEEILGRSAVNAVNFGRLTVLPNGSVYANVNSAQLGVLGKDSLSKIIYKEMDKGNSWRRLRSQVTPCQDCVFELLCPPLSNYEYAIEKNNLCTIWKS